MLFYSILFVGNYLRELILVGINFHEFRKFLAVSRKLVLAKIIGDCATRKIREN